MAFSNRVRLPFFITRPQFPETREVFRLANGETKVQSVIVRKVYEGETDWLPETIHERLKIALSHDNITIEGYRYLSGVGVVQEGDYEIQWVNNFLDFPLGKAAFKAEISPYNNTNDNCQTCEEANQLELVDDTITGLYESLDEGSTTEYNVFTNDSICCKPITASITTINDTYVDSAEIDETTGVVTITLLAETPSATNINLLTYRVTCPNGSYDEADVFANISGSIEVCQAPENLASGEITDSGATLSWTAPTPTPVSYNYQVYLSSDLLTPIITGNTTNLSVLFNDLDPGTCYKFYIQSVCDDGESEYINIEFCTVIDPEICGRWLVTYNNGSGIPGGEPHIFSYLNCSGDLQNDFILNMQSKLICVLQDPDGNPVEINGVTSYEYVEPCS